jgi:hypothetical protein
MPIAQSSQAYSLQVNVFPLGASQNQGHDSPKESTTFSFALIRILLLSLAIHRGLVFSEISFVSIASRYATEATSLMTSTLSNLSQVCTAFSIMPSI